MRKVDKKMPIFNCTSKLRRLAWLLITLLMCQSGFSFAAQCDDYPAEVSSVPEQSKSIGTYDVPEKNVNAGDNTSSEEPKKPLNNYLRSYHRVKNVLKMLIYYV